MSDRVGVDANQQRMSVVVQRKAITLSCNKKFGCTGSRSGWSELRRVYHVVLDPDETTSLGEVDALLEGRRDGKIG